MKDSDERVCARIIVILGLVAILLGAVTLCSCETKVTQLDRIEMKLDYCINYINTYEDSGD